MTWVLRAEEINRGVVMHRPSCAGRLAEQAPLIGRILDTIGADTTAFRSMRTLHWGRLLPDEARDTTLSARLAQAAIRSSRWDARRGRPKAGDSNEFVRAALNQAGMFTELEEVFAARGLSLAVASVEKVLASRAVDLPFFGELESAGLKPADRVPWDAQVWFSIHH